MRHGIGAHLASSNFGASRSNSVRQLQPTIPCQISRQNVRLRSTRLFSTASKSLSSNATTQPRGKELDIGILGGGISGLCTAFYLLAWHQRAFPDQTPKITIYEGSSRVGGWIRTTRKGEPGAHWLFEHGARTLRVRPESMLLQLLKTLGLESKVFFTSKEEPAAQNRYVYRGGNTPEQLGLLPRNLAPQSFEEIWRLIRYLTPLAKHGLKYATKKFPSRDEILANQASGEEDMSLGLLMSWLLGPEFVDQTMSAMVHGIFAADIYKLSAREVLADKSNLFDCYADGEVNTLLEVFRSGKVGFFPDGPYGEYDLRSNPFFKTLVENDRFGIPSADFKVLAGQILDAEDPDWGKFRPISPDARRAGGKYLNNMARVSAFATLEGGLQTLIDRIASHLLSSDVNIQLNTRVTGLDSENGKVAVQTSEASSPKKHDMIISTLDPMALSRANIASPDFAEISPSLTMGVSTVVFQQQENIADSPSFYELANSSFGYLVPTAYSNPETNDSDALGVIFDSGVSTILLNEPLFAKFKEQSPNRAYAKATIISGGRFWQDMPDEKEARQMLAKQNEPTLQNEWLTGAAFKTLSRQLEAPVSPDVRQQGVQDPTIKDKQSEVSDTASFLAKDAIVQHGVGHYAAYQQEVRELEKKFGAGKVWLSGRAAHGNGISQCVDGAVQAAVRVLMEGYGIGKIEEVVRRIRTPPRL